MTGAQTPACNSGNGGTPGDDRHKNRRSVRHNREDNVQLLKNSALLVLQPEHLSVSELVPDSTTTHISLQKISGIETAQQGYRGCKQETRGKVADGGS